jgi:coenzyme Q-binding protein COQ10
MPQFRTTRRVHHPAENMFLLVADVEKYPQFLPLCTGMKVLRREAKGEGVDVLVAKMSVGYRMIHETFTTRVTLDRPNLSILVEYLSGPFSHLENTWKFRPVEAPNCDVEFYISYEFKSRTLGLLVLSVFDTAFRKYTTAFERRADQVYGRPHPGS